MQAAVNKAYRENTIREMANGQPRFNYDSASLEALVKYLSRERLAAYFVMAKKVPERAIRLYERNTELSEALYGVVQGLEVTLRNAVHNTLCTAHGEDWYEKIGLLESECAALTEAKKKIVDRIEQITPGRVVAELNFGFWVRLFSSEYHRTLWGPSFRKIIPMKLDRRAVYDRLKDIKTLRNRIAHHNRIIGQSKTVADLYWETLEASGWFSSSIRLWVEQTNCVEERLSKKFPAAPKPVTVQPVVLIPPEVQRPFTGDSANAQCVMDGALIEVQPPEEDKDGEKVS